MLNKLVGFSLTLLSTVGCFVLFKLLIHGETDIQLLLTGIFFIILYASPFILFGGVASFAIDKIHLKTSNILLYVLLGLLISLIVIGIFNLTSLDILIFIIFTCVVGALVFQLSGAIKNSIMKYIIGVGIPILILIFMYLF
ncbi:hypothetical protein L1N85_04515 [Paenibacillus alkaliterrae]|uniref:hypothetical protein n=1 Tax=Paenibacillus alkaliterrae TaxID=320909 RepID=UPI001F3C5DE6|nr:hypothetical protein [Paenibacillus alkaliterrae]MCF2937697.1 hypothetical protein [Paenibacillus alkaliterrae]